MRLSRLGCVGALLLSAGCGNSGSLEKLPPGCYRYGNFGKDIPVLKVEGTRAQILIPTDVDSADLTWTRQHTVVVRPALLVIEDEKGFRIERNDALPNIALKIVATSPMTIEVPYAPYGYVPLKLGKPCKG